MPAVVVAIPLIALFVAVGLLMLRATWSTSFGPLLEYIANRLDSLRIPIPRAPDISLPNMGGVFRTANRVVFATLTFGIAATAAPFNTLLRYMATVFRQPALAVGELAADTLHTLTNLRRRIIPAMIAAGGALTLAEAVRRSVAAVIPRVGRVERDLSGAWARIRSISRRLAPAAIVAGVVMALGRLRLGWVRCSRVGRVGRRVCAMDNSMLDALLAGTLVIVGTYSLVQFAELMQEVTDDVADDIRAFVGVTSG